MASARYGYTTVSPSDIPSSSGPTKATFAATTSKRPRSASPPASTTSEQQVFESAPIHDRQSTFTGYFSPSMPPHDLQSLPALSSASHRILAYRIPTSSPLSSTKKSRQSTLAFSAGPGAAGGKGSRVPLQTGQDDDGEGYAAKHLAKVLVEMDVVGSLVCARWYGGVMLGPVRFQHIAEAGRAAVRAYLSPPPAGGLGDDGGPSAPPAAQPTSRPLSGSEEAEEKATLVTELEQRDESILSLRTLLAQKRELLASLEGKAHEGTLGGSSSQASPQRKLVYSDMTLERLRMLDQARDKTVAFLLKLIDEVEERIVAWDESGSAAEEEVESENVNECNIGSDEGRTAGAHDE